jgi:hypothetical protein
MADIYGNRWASAPRLTVTGDDGFASTLADAISNLSEAERTCECILYAWDAAAGRMVVVDRKTVTVGRKGADQ